LLLPPLCLLSFSFPRFVVMLFLFLLFFCYVAGVVACLVFSAPYLLLTDMFAHAYEFTKCSIEALAHSSSFTTFLCVRRCSWVIVCHLQLASRWRLAVPTSSSLSTT